MITGTTRTCTPKSLKPTQALEPIELAFQSDSVPDSRLVFHVEEMDERLQQEV
jgi:hypothetical protein